MTDFSKDIQEKFVMYQLLNQRLEEIKQHATIIQQKMIEIETTRIAIEELKKVKKDKDILIPLGSGFYIDGKAGNSDKLLVELGAGIYAKKTTDDASISIEKKKKEVEDAIQALQNEANAITSKLSEIVPELQQAAESQQAGESEEPTGAG